MENNDLKPVRKGVPSDWLLSALRKRGVTLSDICRALDLKESLFNTTNTVLPVAIYNEIFEWGAQHLEDPSLGIHIAETTEAQQLGVLGYLLSNAPTLKDWSELIERYHCIFTPEFIITFQHTGDICHCVYQEAQIPDSETRQDIDISLAGMVETIRRQVDPDWKPTRCTFTYRPPADMSEHHRFFGENLQFNQAHNSFDLDEKLLETPIATADPNLLRILKQQANQLLDQLSGTQDLVRHVRLLITTGLGHEELSTESIAQKLNMSVRNLHRQLRERNTSYRELRDATILQVAKEALLETNASITDIALKLGYSEASAFVRVFKRLEGTSPLQFRKQAHPSIP